MATTTVDGPLQDDVVQNIKGFLRKYYEEAIADLALAYPSRSHLEIDWQDLFIYDSDLADDYLDQPAVIDNHIVGAIENYDLPNPTELSGVEIRVVNLPESAIYSPAELTQIEDLTESGYVGIRGDLAKVTTPARELQVGEFECGSCGTNMRIPQDGDGLDEPYDCVGCDHGGPYNLISRESTFTHHCKVRIESPPDESGQIQSEYVDGIVRDDLVWHGHDDYGLVARTGEPVIVYGTIEPVAESDGSRLFTDRIDVQAIAFDGDKDAVDIKAHRDEFEALADRDDAIDLFAESIAPDMYATPEWDRGLELLVAYLFGAPRIDIDEGPTFRGDIHALIVSDYAMGKSKVNQAIAEFSPDVIKESVTGLSSEVGLLAAAVEDDFGGDQWTLEPGILVRGNGGHVILDEIDKTDANLERMNDALEGEQVVDINKAGQSATYKSRVGLLATGNPSGSRFKDHEPIAEQLDIGESLLSRFDGIVTMRDTPDEDLDSKVAETQGLAYVEAQEYEFGEREELEFLDREVSPAVGRAWVAHARENVHPKLPRRFLDRIKEWYADEVRKLNEEYGATEMKNADMPVPATARVVAGTIRFAVAFARAHLREKVTEADVDRALDLSKTLVGQTFDGDGFSPPEVSPPPTSQQERRDRLQTLIREHQPDGSSDGANVETVIDKAIAKLHSDRGTIRNDIEKLSQMGELYAPAQDEVRTA